MALAICRAVRVFVGVRRSKADGGSVNRAALTLPSPAQRERGKWWRVGERAFFFAQQKGTWWRLEKRALPAAERGSVVEA
jgi:hypothetical protein